MSVLSVCTLLCTIAAAFNTDVQTKLGQPSDGYAHSLTFKHRLRVCNAYPYSAALDVYRGQSQKLTGDDPLPYKTCKDFATRLLSGDRIDFMAGDISAGTFSVSDLPNNDCILLLVIYRHDTLLNAAAFKSHVFANLMNAQIAVIDTYKGVARAVPEIKDLKTSGTSARREALKFNSLVAVNPGEYEIDLVDQQGKLKTTAKMVARNKESYVILRTGVEAQNGNPYPEELVIFPRSLPLKSSAYSRLSIMLTSLLCVCYCWSA